MSFKQRYHTRKLKKSELKSTHNMNLTARTYDKVQMVETARKSGDFSKSIFNIHQTRYDTFNQTELNQLTPGQANSKDFVP